MMEHTKTQDREPGAWHGLDPEEVEQKVGGREEGLNEEEVTERRERYGPNRLPAPETRGPLRRFLTQFNNLLIYVLIGAAAVTALLQHWIDTGVILAVVLLNSIIGFVQEGKAE
ncbi:MAG: cation-transporting P-type ATPase, partial [Thioalkalivibrio sp.]|nr:cation-transporting P-type ATPase [Thioalkalivibrio sp.]